MISVCIATYNGAPYIGSQLKSILEQLSADDEVIISDDGSTDGTVAVVAAMNDKRVKVFENTGTHGVNGNFNTSLSHARGDMIFLADQDDVWLPEKVETCRKALADNICVVHDAVITDGSLQPVGTTLLNVGKYGPGFWRNFKHNGYTGCCMAFRRELLDCALPIPSTRLYYHDQWLGLIAERMGKVAFIPFSGIMFRRHDGISSSAGGASRRSFVWKIRSRISLAVHLAIRVCQNKKLSKCEKLTDS